MKIHVQEDYLDKIVAENNDHYNQYEAVVGQMNTSIKGLRTDIGRVNA